jgi:hypothetical protein
MRRSGFLQELLSVTEEFTALSPVRGIPPELPQMRNDSVFPRSYLFQFPGHPLFLYIMNL